MTEAAVTIKVSMRWKNIPRDLQKELDEARCIQNDSFEFRGRRFFRMEFYNDPGDYDLGYYTIIGLNDSLPDYLEDCRPEFTAQFPRITTDVGDINLYTAGMVRGEYDETPYVDLQASGDNLVRLQHMASALFKAFETVPDVKTSSS